SVSVGRVVLRETPGCGSARCAVGAGELAHAFRGEAGTFEQLLQTVVGARPGAAEPGLPEKAKVLRGYAIGSLRDDHENALAADGLCRAHGAQGVRGVPEGPDPLDLDMRHLVTRIDEQEVDVDRLELLCLDEHF